jgi:hypothetical protein
MNAWVLNFGGSVLELVVIEDNVQL